MTTPVLVPPTDPVWPLLDAIRSCAAAQLGYARRPVTRFPIVFGERPPPADWCACTGPNGTSGSAWARVVPQRIHNQDLRFATSGCEIGRWLHDLEVGVYRCWPTTSDPTKGTPPTAEQLDTAAKGLYTDAAALRRVLGCCTWLTDKDTSPTTATVNAVGPSGGCVAAVLTASIPLDECRCPTGPVPVELGGGR